MNKPKIEAIYPLSFMQQTLLMHSLYEAKDQGFLQLQWTLAGTLDQKLLKQAWQETIQLHPPLRTSLHWENIEKPVQVIHPQAETPWVYEDLQDLSEVAKQARLLEYKQSDQARGLQLSKAPVSRIALVKIAHNQHLLLWSCHHILLDGWSAAIILRDVFDCYNALCNGQKYQAETIPAYRSYLGWLQRQDLEAAETFWKERLIHFQQPALITSPSSFVNDEGGNFEDHEIVLSVEKTQQLQSYIRQQHVTLNTFMLALWGLLIGRTCALDEVVFGTTVSGRSGDLPHMERMTGLFMNVLPVRLSLDPKQPINEWLRSIQAQQLAARNFEHISLDQITSWVKWPGHLPLFDSLVVVGNFPWNNLATDQIIVDGFKGGLTTTYPLTLAIRPDEQLQINLRYNSNRVSSELVSWMAQQLSELLEISSNEGMEFLGDILAAFGESPVSPVNHSIHGYTNQDRMSATVSAGIVSDYAAPTNAIELQLTRIWEEVFDQHPIGTRDNFFHIGGKSLLAVKLFARIAQQMGRNLSPATLLQHPTIESLAEILNTRTSQSSWSSLVPLRASGSKPPLFCVHAGGGHIFFYHPLTRHLDPDQPVYALQPLGMDGEQEKHESIEKMAAHYLEVIRSVIPEGPFVILGTCFSNPVCAEMAIQMKKKGESLSALVIVDSTPWDVAEKVRSIETRIANFKARFRRNPIHAVWKIIDDQLKKIYMIPIKKWGEFRTRLSSDPQARHLLMTQKNLTRLYDQYNWKPFHERVTLIKSLQSVERANNIDVSLWEGLALGGVEVLEVPGLHDTLFQEPDVVGLAKCLQRCMDKAHERIR